MRIFSHLAQHCGSKLSPDVYEYLKYLGDTLMTTGSKTTDESKSKKSGTSLKLKRESRLRPNLIFAMEKFESALIKLGKLWKFNLMKHFKRATARDFKLKLDSVGQMAQIDDDQRGMADRPEEIDETEMAEPVEQIDEPTRPNPDQDEEDEDEPNDEDERPPPPSRVLLLLSFF